MNDMNKVNMNSSETQLSQANQLSDEEFGELREKIKSQIEWDEEYNLTNSDCPTAEFVSSFGYGDGDSREVIRLIQSCEAEYNRYSDSENEIEIDLELLRSLSHKELIELVIKFSTLETYSHYSPGSESVYSASLGELEICLDDILTGETWSKLSSEQKVELEREYCISERSLCAYSSLESEGWSLDFNFDSFLEAYLAGEIEELKPKPIEWGLELASSCGKGGNRKLSSAVKLKKKIEMGILGKTIKRIK